MVAILNIMLSSCETQLITTFQDIAESYDKKGSQIDIECLRG